MSAWKSKVAVVGALGVAVLALVAWPKKDPKPAAGDPPKTESRARDDADDVDGKDGKSPRMILGRVWLDKLPKKRTDEIDVWIFFGGGIGIEDKGSSYRSTLEVFELERQGAKLDVVFLHDQKKQTVKFAVKSCSDDPAFDLCLELDPPLKGVSKLRSWGDDDEMDKAMPWGREVRKAAEARARGAKP